MSLTRTIGKYFIASFCNMSIPSFPLLPSSFSKVRQGVEQITQHYDKECVSYRHQERISLCRSRHTTVGVLKSPWLWRGEGMCDILLFYCTLQLTDRWKGIPIVLPAALQRRGEELPLWRKSVMQGNKHHIISGWLTVARTGYMATRNVSDKDHQYRRSATITTRSTDYGRPLPLQSVKT